MAWCSGGYGPAETAFAPGCSVYARAASGADLPRVWTNQRWSASFENRVCARGCVGACAERKALWESAPFLYRLLTALEASEFFLFTNFWIYRFICGFICRFTPHLSSANYITSLLPLGWIQLQVGDLFCTCFCSS